MLKRDLLKWLDEQHLEAKQALRDKHDFELTSAKEALYVKIGLPLLAEEIRGFTIDIDEALNKWVAKNAETVQMKNYYNSLASKIRPYTYQPQEVIKELLYSTFSITTKELVSLRKRHTEELDSVTKNYQGVIAQAQGLKNAKEIGDYLEKLGFNLALLQEKLATPVVTALAIPIDTRFLHISKEVENG